MKIVAYERWREVEQLQEQWNPLLQRSASDTYFLTWEWLSSWWHAYGAGREPLVLGAWEGDRLVGLAPLYVERVRKMGASWKIARLMGDGSNDSDYLDFFAEAGREAEFAAAVIEHLASRRDAWDLLELHGPRTMSPFAMAFSDSASKNGWRFETQDVPCLTLDLPGTWDEYLQNLKPRFRTKVRSGLAFVEQQLKLSPVECTTEEQLRDWLPPFFDLHGKRWHTRGQAGVFGNEAKRAFYFEVSCAALRSGTLSFHRLDWGERPLAFQYGFNYGNQFLLLQEAYDPEFESLRPGLALRGFRLREMIAAGVKQYDFLAGVAPHKLEWGAATQHATKLVVARSAAAASVFLKAPALKSQAKELVRRMLPASLLALRKKLSAPTEPGSATRSAHRSIKSLIAGVYAATPLHKLGKTIADRYQMSGAARTMPFSIEQRESPACQILLYHKVNDDRDPFLHALPVDEFRSQMEYIARNFHVVSLDDVAAGRIGGDGKKFSVAVTFDDGYRDNFTNAFPILKELGIPATIYLATGYIGTGKLPWYDQVCLAFKLTVRPALKMEPGAPAGSFETEQNRLTLLDKALDWLRHMDDDTRGQQIPRLFRALGVPDSLTLPNYMLNWDEVRQMKTNNITFGAHTVNHPVLSQLSLKRLQEEIAGSKKTIEQKLNAEVRHFAYPFGRPQHFNDAVKRVVEQSGMSTAVTTVYGYNQVGDDPLTLKRFTPWAHDKANFMMQLDWYRFAGIESPETTGSMAGAPVAVAKAS